MNTDRFKFRAWCEKFKVYAPITGEFSIPGEPYNIAFDPVHISADGRLYAVNAYDGEELCQVDDVTEYYTIEQCTGLKDKNGKLIYEGDIVCYDDTPYNGYATKKTGVVVYRKAGFCYKYSDCCGGLYQPLVPSDDFWQRKTEIIGNVHEIEVTK